VHIQHDPTLHAVACDSSRASDASLQPP
jgi:hypothetical protein